MCVLCVCCVCVVCVCVLYSGKFSKVNKSKNFVRPDFRHQIYYKSFEFIFSEIFGISNN